MSKSDIDLVEELGLSRRELGGYLGVTSQSFGQGLQASKRYLDDQRLAPLYAGLEASGHHNKLLVVKKYVQDESVFAAALAATRLEQGPLGKVTGLLICDYVWFLRQTERLREEWALADSFINGETPHRLIIASEWHNIPAASHGNALRSLLESRYLVDFGKADVYQASAGQIQLVSIEFDLFMAELLIPFTSEYNAQSGFVCIKDGFAELPTAMVSDMAGTVSWEFSIVQPREGIRTVIREAQIRLTWTSHCLPYLNALKLFMKRHVPLPEIVATALWDALGQPDHYVGDRVDWNKVVSALSLPECGNLTVEVEVQPDKRMELATALRQLAPFAKIDEKVLDDFLNKVPME